MPFWAAVVPAVPAVPALFRLPGRTSVVSPLAPLTPGGRSGGRARERAARRGRPSGRKGPGVSSAGTLTAPGGGREEPGRPRWRSSSAPSSRAANEARQAIPGDACVRAARRTSCFEHGEVPRRRDRAEGETRPDMRTEAGRVRNDSAIEREPDIPVTLAAGSVVRLALLGGQREGTGDHGLGCLQVRGCGISCQRLPCRGPCELKMGLRADRPSRRPRKQRPPARRVQIRAERPAVHIPAIAVHRPGQPHIKPGRQRGPPPGLRTAAAHALVDPATKAAAAASGSSSRNSPQSSVRPGRGRTSRPGESIRSISSIRSAANVAA